MATTIWTKHADKRQQEWHRELGITRQDVENVLDHPEQVVEGDMAILVAQARYKNVLLRVLYAESGGERRIITLYWTSKVDRYWKE